MNEPYNNSYKRTNFYLIRIKARTAIIRFIEKKLLNKSAKQG